MHKTRLVLFSLTLLIGVLFVAKAIINLKKPNSSQPAITISPIPSSPTPTKTIPVPVFNSIKIGKNELNVEIALTPEEIQQGLSGRNEIGSDGMLFVISPPPNCILDERHVVRDRYCLDIKEQSNRN